MPRCFVSATLTATAETLGRASLDEPEREDDPLSWFPCTLRFRPDQYDAALRDAESLLAGRRWGVPPPGALRRRFIALRGSLVGRTQARAVLRRARPSRD